MYPYTVPVNKKFTSDDLDGASVRQDGLRMVTEQKWNETEPRTEQ